MGSLIVSIAIIVIIAAFMIIGYVRGFMKQVLGFIGGLAALVVAIILCRPVANIIFANTNWMAGLASKIADVFNLPDTEVEAQNLTAALSEMNYPEFMQASMVKMGESMNEATVNLSIVISQTIARFVIIAICFVVLFIVLLIVIKLIKGIANLLSKLPVVGLLDKILGVVLGLVFGLITVNLLLFLFSIIPFSFLEPVRDAINSSGVATFFLKFNLIAIILAWIAMI